MGPDLSDVGKGLSKRQILESILDPSKDIDPKYAAYIVEVDDGRQLSGLIVERTRAGMAAARARGRQDHAAGRLEGGSPAGVQQTILVLAFQLIEQLLNLLHLTAHLIAETRRASIRFAKRLDVGVERIQPLPELACPSQLAGQLARLGVERRIDRCQLVSQVVEAFGDLPA